MAKPKRLTIRQTEGRDGRVVITMAAPNGRDYELDLSVFDVSTLVSTLYEARGEALKQEPDRAPEVLLPLTKIEIGTRHTNHGIVEVLRMYLTAKSYQDFAALAGSELAEDLKAVGLALAKRSDPPPAGDEKLH